MSDIQSIEDLIASSKGGGFDDESALGKFQAKQKEINVKEVERLTEQNAVNLGVSYISLFGFPISPEALSLITEQDARQFNVVCFFYDGQKIRLGALEPHSEAVVNKLEELCATFFCEGETYLISKNSLEYAIRLYNSIPKVRVIPRGVELTEDDLNKFSEKFSSFADLQKEINQAKVTDIVTMVMAASIKLDASDIHIEAEEDGIKVRFRVDGVLHDASVISKDLWKKIISRLKVIAKVKINIADKPQDGRMSIITAHDRIDIRVSFLPTNFGESVVMRILKASSVGLAFNDLGIRDRAFEQLRREVERPNGMIITTGPTGSGKTTTLYAILKKLNNQETKIITIEDPIEYQLEGVNQSQISEKYTFAQGLRSIVRQDPDIIMVGEIRDLETAEIAIQASLTGHLVLSTIHTNDAAGTVPRFISMGTKPFLLAPALNAMIGQRLVRRICEKCKVVDELDEEKRKRALDYIKEIPAAERGELDFDKIVFYKGAGCEACQGIGYKGRIGIYEIVVVDEDMEKLILSGAVNEYDMRAAAAKKGTLSMAQDGMLKVLDGITSVEEVFRVAE
ncbi:MAG: Type II secretion system protein E [Candidatus Falkowbacteria bacterium GW2011_GWC2_38_22]|uniref:Type II secretion system protein E n=1 Tax=Candidatus Falkowbacteria bacterium GW2011_GWE1_38_31 TaxID=1618638 RepID=A0A0G0K6X6_9BACT|nr:MAG: Type II secretion system protein E [Candidatus Falkowbacteria bacterium GW2011_GWF2_38_1205]KKQ61786.1 MAG: Type II secretion system protein E [Candidatus Falkowbacteria bacterium GW2011_GWC2_38_22]KKQ64094.1 MAG: Type II secretion system protein E [Candidatus Falkowbacteria bacterium GW2011_GWF1_38_22]KKQ66557.1 MAG: Type II secretion system protein E [Candidatus Falkowbacteria bacterium GW2011_GWE2_38_254]KKQ71200.1 MAG: Type II secretion system protein E [Candidatus Falkowbacteria ba